MIPTSFMLIAGEASGDRLAAELVTSLRADWWRRFGKPGDPLPPLRWNSGPVFFGAGGEAMREAGVELVEDMTHRAVIGIGAVFTRLFEFARLMNRLVRTAAERQPDVIITVDYGGFNLRFQSRIRRLIRARRGPFNNWQPKLVQFVSPQVWGSRPGRAFHMERDLDLLISILPFEPAWFQERTPRLRVAFVGHPLIGRHAAAVVARQAGQPRRNELPLIALLPGSRPGELAHHLPVLLEAVQHLRAAANYRFKLIVATENLATIARRATVAAPLEIVVGEVSEVLREASVALTKTGTITLELALFGVPAVTFYKTNWPTYWAARQVVTVRWLSMPNLLAGEAVYPEFVQHAATGEALATALLQLLNDRERKLAVQRKLGDVVAKLGQPGAPDRAAAAIFSLFQRPISPG